jgi:hypothetical protein
MVMSTWLQTCSYSRYDGFAEVPDFLHRILVVLPSGLSMSLSLPDIFVSLRWPRVYLTRAGPSPPLHLGTRGLSVVVRRLRYFISSGNTASAPYINQNGVKFVTLHTVVLWLHIAIGMISAHLPFFSPSSIFLIPLKIREIALSTAPLDCGWYTDANATFVLICWQKLLNIALSKYFALSTVICRGTP